MRITEYGGQKGLSQQSNGFLEFIDKYPALRSIGNTPMVKLDLPIDMSEAEIYVKLEQLNPGGSLKDRPVVRMIVEAILSGELTKDKIIIDATSGNAGIAYAMVGAVLGYRVELVMPSNASEERKKRIKAHGADIIYTDPMLGYDETLREVKRRCQRNKDKYFYCDQYENLNNPLAHYETTAEEIIKQVSDVTHFVAGVGTGGTISGIGKRLKEYNSDIQIVLINFDEWPGVEGLKPLGPGHIIPGIFDQNVVDRMITVDVDDGYQMSKMLSSIGIFAGQSSGAYVQGAYQIAVEANKCRVVTILNDLGERYFSTGMWEGSIR